MQNKKVLDGSSCRIPHPPLNQAIGGARDAAHSPAMASLSSLRLIRWHLLVWAAEAVRISGRTRGALQRSSDTIGCHARSEAVGVGRRRQERASWMALVAFWVGRNVLVPGR